MAGLLDATEFAVAHRPKIVELRSGYDLTTTDGRVLGSAEQVGRDNLERTLRPRKADHGRTSFEVRDADGRVELLLTHIQALKSSLEVARPDGTEVGRIRRANVVGKARFAIEAAGAEAGAIAADTWRNKHFGVADAAGRDIGRVAMTAGSSGDHAHANTWAVQLEGQPADPLRALAFVAVLAVDLILWQR